MALDYVRNNSLDNKFVIFSDSLSVLESLNHTSSKNPKIQNLIETHHELSRTKESLLAPQPCWHKRERGCRCKSKGLTRSRNFIHCVLNFHIQIVNLLSTGTSYSNGRCHGTERHSINYTERKKKRRVNFIPKFHSSLKKFVKYFTMITKRYMYGTEVPNFIGL